MARTLEMMTKEDMDSWGTAEFYSTSCKREKQTNFSDSYNSRNTQTYSSAV